MEYTNYTFEFKGVIDYIFHSQPHMRPLGVLGPVGFFEVNYEGEVSVHGMWTGKPKRFYRRVFL